MTARKTKTAESSGEELGLKLLQSVREMKAGIGRFNQCFLTGNIGFSSKTVFCKKL